jgi:hypothetical protein
VPTARAPTPTRDETAPVARATVAAPAGPAPMTLEEMQNLLEQERREREQERKKTLDLEEKLAQLQLKTQAHDDDGVAPSFDASGFKQGALALARASFHAHPQAM